MFSKISNRINILMEKEGISGMQLARKINIPPSTIKKIRNKEITNPTLATLVPIARYFAVSVDYLLGEESSNEYFSSQHISWEEIKTTPTQIFILSIDKVHSNLLPPIGYIVVDSSISPNNYDLVIAEENNQILIFQYFKNNDETYLRCFENLIPIKDHANLIGVIIAYRK